MIPFLTVFTTAPPAIIAPADSKNAARITAPPRVIAPAQTAGPTLFATSFAPIFIAIYAPKSAANKSIGFVRLRPKYIALIIQIIYPTTMSCLFIITRDKKIKNIRTLNSKKRYTYVYLLNLELVSRFFFCEVYFDGSSIKFNPVHCFFCFCSFFRSIKFNESKSF